MKKILALTLIFGALFPLLVSAQFGATSQRPVEEVKIASVTAISIDEVVVIENQTRQQQDLTGWTLEAARPGSGVAAKYSFPDDCFLPQGATVRVHSGPANVGRFDTACGENEFDLIWQTSFVLPNDVGILTLRNADGGLTYTLEYPEPIIPPVFINEIELNPESGNEWIELFNAGDGPVDMSGWTVTPLRGTSVKLSVPVDTTIPAGGFVVVQFPIPLLSDQGEIVELRNAKGLVISTTPEAGLLDPLADNRCWARMPDGFNAWNFQACTKAASNFNQA